MGDQLDYLSEAKEWLITFAPKFLIACIVLFIGFKLVKKLKGLIDKGFEKSKIEPEIGDFLEGIVDIVLKVVVVLIAVSILGFQMSSLVGILAGAVFAIGLALQGFLGNFASGLTIIFFQPYKINDWVEVAGTFGRVRSIQIFNTILTTPGQKTIIVPNGKVTDDIITNFSTEGQIRLELMVTMPYEESFPRVKGIIQNALQNIEYILDTPAPIIGIDSYDSHNINITIKPFINPNHYWEATHTVYQKVKEAFNQNNIKVAYSEGVELGPIGK